ncbi:MAG: tryptophan 2,3-dioxygenase [Thermoanaerobaculia bacterium]
MVEPKSQAASKPLTYASYLKVEELLSLQQPLSEGPEHDEMLFILIHQVYELWFKEVLHELDYLKARLTAGDATTSQATLKRILTVFKTLVAQIDVLETMTPVDFNSFRFRLESASGFQSGQFRELEFVLGRKRESMVRHFGGTPTAERLARRLGEPTVWDAFLRFLARKEHPVPQELLDRDVSAPAQPDPRIQDILIGIYRDDPEVSAVCERLVDLDEGLQEWRYRHVKMVERTIGMKPGTGGSAGADYLRTTLFEPVFPDLWAIRSRL